MSSRRFLVEIGPAISSDKERKVRFSRERGKRCYRLVEPYSLYRKEDCGACRQN